MSNSDSALSGIFADFVAEMIGAAKKHSPMHVGGDQISDDQRWNALVAEVMEVRDALVDSREHPHDVDCELVQVGGLVAAWLLRRRTEMIHCRELEDLN